MTDANQRMENLGNLALLFTGCGLASRAAEATESALRLAEEGSGYATSKAIALAYAARAVASAGDAAGAGLLADQAVLLSVTRDHGLWNRHGALPAARLLAEAGYPDRAMQLTCHEGAGEARLNEVITGLVSSGRFQEAAETALSACQGMRYATEPDAADRVLRATFIRLAEASATGPAELLFNRHPFQLGSLHSSDDAVRRTFRALVGAGASSLAIRLGHAQRDGYPRTGCLKELGYALADSGFTAEALATAELIAELGRPDGDRPRVHVLREAADLFIKSGNPARAVEIADEIIQSHYMSSGPQDRGRSALSGRSAVLQEAAQILLNAGQEARAMKTAWLALPYARQRLAYSSEGGETRQSPSPVSWIAVIAARCGRIDLATEIASTPSSNRDREIILSEISKALIDLEKLEDAISIASALEYLPARQEPLGLAAGKLAARGDLSGALQITKTLTGQWRPAWAARQVVEGLVRSGNTDDAERVAISIASAPEWAHTSESREAVLRVIESRISDGRFARSLQLSDYLVDPKVRYYNDPRTRDDSMAHVVGCLTAGGAFPEAMTMSRRIRDPAVRMKALIQIVEDFGLPGGEPSEPICEASRCAVEISAVHDSWVAAGQVFDAAVSLNPALSPTFAQFWESVSS